MNRYITGLLSVITVLAAAGCQTSTTSGSDPQPDSTARSFPPPSAHADAAATAEPVAVTVVEGAKHDSLNVFPVDFGDAPLIDATHRLVPQERGLDKRPAGTKLAFATQPSGTLVLYDSTGSYGWLGELFAIASLNLASHFGPTDSKPVAQYVAGDMAPYKAVIYVGSTYGETLPVAFLDDVLAGTVPVIWLYDNIWQLANRSATFITDYGFNPWAFDISTIDTVTYKATALTRDGNNGGGIMQFNPLDAVKVTVLATAKRADGTELPWAIRAKNLTYVGEMPFSYIDFNDRYLAFCDLLFDTLAPTQKTRHRALLRIEDINPTTSPTAFRAEVDYLFANGVPFAVAVVPMYLDPQGLFNGGKSQALRWVDRPLMLAELKYAATHGGSLIMHGYSHQFGNSFNPYNGVTADDFEFFQTHVDPVTDNVIYDGPVPGDSPAWALGRINAAFAAFAAAGLAAPTVFEYPHYAGSPVDSVTISGIIGTAYHRGLYFGGDLGTVPSSPNHRLGQFFPYTVTDVYGWYVLPENIGNFEPLPYNNHPARLPADLIASAKSNLVIRDGFASFFFHPYYSLANLKAIVTGIKAAGYTFVSIDSL